MLTIRDIMTQDVQSIAPDTSIRSAMEFLVANHLTGAPVVSGQSLVGVVSATDLLSFAATIRNELPTFGDATESAVAPDEDPEPFVDTSGSSYFSEVWDDDVGDIATHLGTSEFSEWRVLDEHDVSEVMTRNVWSLPSTASAREAAALMQTHGIHRVLVVDEGQVVGIITALDITRAVANGRFNVRTYVFNRDRDFASRG